ncbi:MAG: DUF642 domain-containing protein [Phycisphaerales bacterium]|nr:DUF642 domain-containing protein [Phycisphaerales bacterium]
MSKCVAGLMAVLLCASLAGADIVQNGSFETYGGSGNSNIGMGIAPWVIGSPGIDIVIPELGEGHYWLPADGEVSISLNWFNPASISQALVTTPGQPYEVSFWMAAEIYGGPQWRTMDVTWNGALLGSPAFEYTGQGPENMGWTRFSYSALGTGNDILAFLSTTPANFGPALDNVSVTAVPVPGTLALMSVGLLALKRRRRAAS